MGCEFRRRATKSLQEICDLALQAKIYPECIKNYPFVLGTQSLRMIDLAAFYAAIVNEGLRVTPLRDRFDRAERPCRLQASARRCR